MTGGVLTGVSVAVGNDAVFSCHATGVPAPEFRWLLNGTEYLNGVITGDTDVRETSIYVESTLRLSRVIEAQTGSVTCMAFHYNSGEIVTVSSTTNLVVLSEFSTHTFPTPWLIEMHQAAGGGSIILFKYMVSLNKADH